MRNPPSQNSCGTVREPLIEAQRRVERSGAKQDRGEQDEADGDDASDRRGRRRGR